MPSACPQGAAIPSLEKIPEPIKEATALFYGERQPQNCLGCGWEPSQCYGQGTHLLGTVMWRCSQADTDSTSTGRQ